MQQQCSGHIICEDTRYVGRRRETANQLPSGPLMQLQLLLQMIQIKKAIFSFGDTNNLQKQTVTITTLKRTATEMALRLRRSYRLHLQGKKLGKTTKPGICFALPYPLALKIKAYHPPKHRDLSKLKLKTKLHGLSPRANYTDRAGRCRVREAPRPRGAVR
jgi:hypothetical protein